jgi:hypothetical protein
MAIGITNDTFSERPYISVAEYKNAPTSIDYDNLVVGGNLAAQDAELERVILRASSYMDEYLNQNLVANRQTETQRTRFTPQGYIALHPNQNPIISLESFLKLLLVVGGLEEIVEAIKPVQPAFASIDEVLKDDDRSIRKRGRHQ